MRQHGRDIGRRHVWVRVCQSDKDGAVDGGIYGAAGVAGGLARLSGAVAARVAQGRVGDVEQAELGGEPGRARGRRAGDVTAVGAHRMAGPVVEERHLAARVRQLRAVVWWRG